MKQPRFYEPTLPAQGLSFGERLILSPDSQQHAKALRLRDQSTVVLFSGYGGEDTGVYHQSEQTVVIENHDEINRMPSRQQSLVVPVCQPQKFAWIVQKATECGVSSIYPVVTERSKSTGVRDIKPNQFHRYQQIMSQACQQSGRNLLPRLHQVSNWKDKSWLSEYASPDQWFFCHPQGQLMEFNRLQAFDQPLLWMIGPEGGWSDEECQWMADCKGQFWSFGPGVLRMETACVAVLSLGLMLG